MLPGFKNFRSDHLEELVQHERAPLVKEDLKKVEFFEIKKKYAVEARFTEKKEREEFDMLTYSGKKKKYYTYGHIDFSLSGKDIRLALYKSVRLEKMPQYASHLFLPFKDTTNGDETYGGGRYIDLETSDLRDGMIFIDFNKAYNPWCAYSDGYSCPIPPIENHISIPVRAGEKTYRK